jgi:hypothetical protein
MSVADFHHAAKQGLAHGPVFGWIGRHGFAAALAFCLIAWAGFAGLVFVAAKLFF